jgi:hypothetical protein
MSNIYEISKELENFLATLPETGELSDEDLAIYAELHQIADEKIKSTAYAFLNLKSKLETIKSELDRIAKLKKSVESQMNRIERLVEFGMELDKTESKDFGSLRVYFTKSIGTVVDDESLVPMEFCKVKYTVDLTKAKEVLKKGGIVEGVRLEARKNLQIK